jgi:hypothetical protein
VVALRLSVRAACAVGAAAAAAWLLAEEFGGMGTVVLPALLLVPQLLVTLLVRQATTLAADGEHMLPLLPQQRRLGRQAGR